MGEQVLPSGRYMKILVSVETGEPTVAAVEIDDKGQERPAHGLERINPSSVYDNNPRHLGTLVHTHSSPGCVIWIGGTPYKIC